MARAIVVVKGTNVLKKPLSGVLNAVASKKITLIPINIPRTNTIPERVGRKVFNTVFFIGAGFGFILKT